MAKYKVGDIFINHKDGKILQVCKGDCCKDCCYNKVHSNTCLEGVSCSSLIGLEAYFKELPFLPSGTKVKVRKDLKEGSRYGCFRYCRQKGEYKEITIKTYDINSKSYKVNECPYSYTIEMFNQVINESKENNNMETKEIKIKVLEGYEIDKENSTFECIKFKLIKKELTYEDVAEELFSSSLFTLDTIGRICHVCSPSLIFDKYNATSKKQLERLLALNQLLNIAEYYNKKNPQKGAKVYCINLDGSDLTYYIQSYLIPTIIHGLIPTFNNKEDAEAVMNNPNFKGILDLLYKGYED